MNPQKPRFDGFSALWDTPAPDIHGFPLFPGFLEPASGCIDVVDKVAAAIASNKNVIPQKYLYASLNGARLWKSLCDGHSHIAEVYRQFPLKQRQTAFIQTLVKQVETLMAGRADNKLGVVALGSGTGKREAELCDWLAVELKLNRLYVVLLDVSSELLGVSLQNFNDLPKKISPLFAVMDFESDAGLQHLQALRNTWGEHPALFLFLGNTLGNLDEVTFLKRIAKVMRPDDLLLCEMLLTSDTERRETYDPSEDPRVDFIIDPLRSLGLNPRPTSLECHVTSDKGKWRRQEFRYFFSKDDEVQELSVAPRPSIVEGNWVGLLEIQADTADGCRETFERVFERFELAEHEYDVDGKRVVMGYCFARGPKSKSRVVTKASTSSAVLPGNIGLDAGALGIEFRGDRCPLSPTHLALVAVLQKAESAWKALDVQREVVAWLEAYSPDGEKLNQKAKDKLNSLKQGVASHDTNPVSTLKEDAESGLKYKAKQHVAAAELLKVWPEKSKWCFRSSS
ncbi:MAG: L-histidine N(alpha)-methyltransferase [Verrucomicrobiia bacterium]